MNCRFKSGARLARACFGLLAISMVARSAAGELVVLKTIAQQEGDARLDFAAVDPSSRRLYVARGFGVTAVDLDGEKVTRQLVAGQHVHAVVPLPNGRVISTNGDTNSATLFEGASGKVIAQIPTGNDPDAAVFDPASGLVLVMNAKDGDATLIDPAAGKAVGKLPIGGKLEFAVADGHGRIYVNIEDQNAMAVIDTVARKVVGHYPLPGCDGPTGLGFDAESGLLVAACANRLAVAIHAADGSAAADKLAIDRHPDAVIYDAARKAFYVPCGRDGTLAVITQAGGGRLSVTSKIPTAVGAHTGALDPKTGLLYLPTADYHLTLSGFAPADGSFRILVLGAG
jgi:DNA-binding beta-propeller fold protein YncE